LNNTLTRPICARNAGVGILLRATIVSLLLLSLNMIFELPGDGTITAAIAIKSNLLLFILVGLAFFVIGFLTLLVAFPVNNVFSHVNRELSLRYAQLRLLEGFIFVAGLVILFLEFPIFSSVLMVSQVLYAVCLIVLGYLVYQSKFVHRILGILLIVGGSVGYAFALVTRFIPSLALVSSIGVGIAFIAEVFLGINLLALAIQRLSQDPDPKVTITNILTNTGALTTKEILEEAAMVSVTCQDRIPNTLVLMEQENLITKRLSKEKKGYVWELVE